MRNKKFTVLVIGLLVLFTLVTFAETKKLKNIGRYTLVRVKGEVPTSEVMKTLVDRYSGDIKYGFDLAGYGDLYLPFIQQVQDGKFEEKNLAVGDKFMWMLFRSRGKVKVVEDLEWAGSGPLPVFSFTVLKDYKYYEFVMPKPCGNISLVKVWEAAAPDAVCNIVVTPNKANVNDTITVNMGGSQNAQTLEVEVYDADGNKIATQSLSPGSPTWQTSFDTPGEYVFKGKAMNADGKAAGNPCEARTYINAPPDCKLWTTCLPCKDYVGKPITIDASQSADPDGQVAKVDFEIRDSAGMVVDTFTDTDSPFTWEKVFSSPGIYTVTANVTDDFGAMSGPCQLEFEVTQKKLFFLVEAGPLLAKGTYTSYLFARAGLMYKFVPDKFSFVLAAGPAFPLTGNNEWKTFFMVNGIFNIHAGPTFFGAGLGYTTKDQDADGRGSGLDIVGQAGVDIFKSYTSTGSLFFELRVPVGSDRKFEDLHKLALGLRLIF